MRPSSRGRTGREPRAVSTVNGGPPHTKTIAGRIFAATLAGLEAHDWTTQRGSFGHLVESFVLQQLMAQAGWTDPDPQFWHCRDRDQVEVDIVVTRGRKTWGVEVKAAAKVTPSDGAGLRRLAEQCGKDFQGGILFYVGASTIPTVDHRIIAVPVAGLWTS